MLKRDWTTSSNINNYAIPTSEHIWKTYISNSYFNKHALLITLREVYFLFYFCRCFIVDVPIQHEFCCVNLNGKRWRTWKTNQITPKYLRSKCNTSQVPAHHKALALKALLIVSILAKWTQNIVACFKADLIVLWGYKMSIINLPSAANMNLPKSVNFCCGILLTLVLRELKSQNHNCKTAQH